jgi:OmpA-OmpF porin, OOP family
MKAIYKVIILYSVLCFNLYCETTAQNLVLNPIFKEFTMGVDMGNSKYAGGHPYHWKILCGRLAFIRVALINRPFNGGFQVPEYPSARADGRCFSLEFKKNVTSAVQGTLSQPLEKDSLYLISLFVLHNPVTCVQAFTEISISLFNKDLSNPNDPFNVAGEMKPLDVPYVQLVSKEYKVLDQSKKWMKVSASYVAKGGEKYITIGNFGKANEQVFSMPALKDSVITYFFDSLTVSKAR